jgi:hypothetical protein
VAANADIHAGLPVPGDSQLGNPAGDNADCDRFSHCLVIAWAFELTPVGLKRTEFAEQLPKKSARSRAWIYVVVVAGAISVGLFFMGRYTATNKQSELTQLPAKYLRLSAVRYIQAVRSCGSDI